MNLKNLAGLIMVLCAYVYVNDPGHVFTAEVTPNSISVESYTTTTDQTPGRDIFNPGATLDTSGITDSRTTEPCSTDLDCVTRHPEIIPDGYTIRAYQLVWGDQVHFPTTGDCSRVDWLAQDEDGNPFVPIDLNGNGAIDCASDYELGA